MKYTDLMLDIETYGQGSNATILAIAAVEFDLKTGETGREFYHTIKADGQSRWDRVSDKSTMDWWSKQSYEARKHVFGGDQLNLGAAMKRFVNWIGNTDYAVWGNGSSFDCVITKNAIEACGYECPWKFWNERDVRTLVHLNPYIKKNTPFEGVPHYAPDDCKHQIKYCHNIYKSLTGIAPDITEPDDSKTALIIPFK